MKLIHRLFSSGTDCCESTTRLVEKSAIQPLTFSEQVKLKKHFAMCAVCKAYEAQSKIIDQVIGKWFDNNREQKLSDETKAKIIKNIRTS